MRYIVELLLTYVLGAEDIKQAIHNFEDKNLIRKRLSNFKKMYLVSKVARDSGQIVLTKTL